MLNLVKHSKYKGVNTEHTALRKLIPIYISTIVCQLLLQHFIFQRLNSFFFENAETEFSVQRRAIFGTELKFTERNDQRRSSTRKNLISFILSRTNFVFVPAGRVESAEELGTEGGLTNCTRIHSLMNCDERRGEGEGVQLCLEEGKVIDEGMTPRSSIFAYLVPAKEEARKAQHFDLE
jgi:hypothetical protein